MVQKIAAFEQSSICSLLVVYYVGLRSDYLRQQSQSQNLRELIFSCFNVSSTKCEKDSFRQTLVCRNPHSFVAKFLTPLPRCDSRDEV